MRQRISTPSSLITGKSSCIQLNNDFLPKTRFIFPTPPPEKNFYVPYVAKFSPHNLLQIFIGGENGRIGVVNRDRILERLNSETLSYYDSFDYVNTRTVADSTIYDLIFLPNDPTTICIGSDDKTIRFLDTTRIEVSSIHKGHLDTPQTLYPFRNGVLSGGRDGKICFWDKRIENPAFSSSLKKGKIIIHISSIIAPTDDLFISGDDQGKILVWDPRSPETPFFSIPVLKTENQTKNPIVNLSISPNSKMMAALMSNNTLNIFSLDGEWRYVSKQWPKIGTFFTRTCFSPDSKYIITGSGSGTIFSFPVTLDKPPVLLLGHTEQSTCVEWCNDLFDYILSCSNEKIVQLWVANPELAKTDEPDIDPVVASANPPIQERPPTITRIYTLHHYM